MTFSKWFYFSLGNNCVNEEWIIDLVIVTLFNATLGNKACNFNGFWWKV